MGHIAYWRTEWIGYVFAPLVEAKMGRSCSTLRILPVCDPTRSQWNEQHISLLRRPKTTAVMRESQIVPSARRRVLSGSGITVRCQQCSQQRYSALSSCRQPYKGVLQISRRIAILTLLGIKLLMCTNPYIKWAKNLYDTPMFLL